MSWREHWNLDSLTPKQGAFCTARLPFSSESLSLRCLSPDPEIQMWEGDEKEEGLTDKRLGRRHTGANRIELACLIFLSMGTGCSTPYMAEGKNVSMTLSKMDALTSFSVKRNKNLLLSEITA